MGACNVPIGQITGAIGEFSNTLSVFSPVMIFAFVTAYFFLKNKNWSNTAPVVLVLHGVVYYAVALIFFSVVFSLPFPFVLLLIRSLFLYGMAFGLVALSVLLWFMLRSQYPTGTGVSIHIAKGLLAALFLCGTALTYWVFALTTNLGQDVNRAEIRMYKNAEECFIKGGDSFQITKGDTSTVYFPDGTSKIYSRIGEDGSVRW